MKKKTVTKFFQNFLLAILSIFAILMVLEWLSRIFLSQAHTYIVDESGAITSMQINPGHPQQGLRSNFRGRMRSGEFDVEITLDGDGFRSPVKAGPVEAGRPLYITLLGDSFMFGWGVELSTSFAGHLCKDLSSHLDREIFITNLAVPATGQWTQLQLLKNAYQPKPDVVILGTYICDQVASGNDLLDNVNEYYLYSKDNSAFFNQNRDSEKIGLLRRTRRFLKQRSNLFRFIEARFGSLILAKFSGAMQVQKEEAFLEKAWKNTESVLMLIKNEADQKGALFVIQYCPNILDVSQHNLQVYGRLKQFCDRAGVLLAPNAIEIFNRDDNYSIEKYYFMVDGHWTPAAHKVCAEEMSKLIIDHLSESRHIISASCSNKPNREE